MRTADPATRAIVLLGVVLALELAWLESMGIGAFVPAPTPTRDQDAASAGPATAAPAQAASDSAPADGDQDAPVLRTPIEIEAEDEISGIPPTPEDRSCSIAVIAPGGPASYRHVFAVERGGTSVVATGLTHENGVATLPGDGRVVDLLVDAGTTIHREPDVRLDPGLQTVNIPTGVAISGRVMLGDRPANATDGLTVDFIRDESPRLAALPAALRRSLDDWAPLPLHCKVGDGGAFRCDGFEPAWKGRLAVRPIERVEMIDADRTSDPVLAIDVSAPAQDLIVAARLRPVLRGRLAIGQGTRLDDRLICVAIRGQDPRREERGAARASEGWRFEIPLPRSLTPPLAVRFSSCGRSSDLAREVAITAPCDRDVDLGTIEFPCPSARRAIVVTDRENRPIEGAVVELAGDSSVRGRPTDENGVTDLDVTPRNARVVVEALGFARTETALPEFTDPVRIVVVRTTRLEVSVVTTTPGSTPYVRLEPAASPTQAWAPAFHEPASFADLPDGIPITVTVVDHKSLASASERIVLAAAEWRRIEIVLPKADARLSGRVTTEDGSPIAGAQVVANRVGSSGKSVGWPMTTDDAGRFGLDGIVPGPLDLTISADGLMPLVLKDVDSNALDDATFVLHPGRSVRVSVVDEAGDPFVRRWMGPGCHHDWEIWMTVPGSDFRFSPAAIPCTSFGGSPRSPAGHGIYDFSGLPEGLVTIHVEGAGEKIYTLEHDTRIAEARLVVPTHGRLRAKLGVRLDSKCTRLRLEPVSPGLTPLAVVDSAMVEYDGGVTLPEVLPGDYRASFEVLDSRAAWVPATAEKLVTIRPGATTTVTLDRRP